MTESATSEDTCRLCLCVAELRNSHIISEFVYEQLGIYDEKHRFGAYSTDPGDRVETHQKGLREKLLCEGCEGRRSAWETYARSVLFGGTALDMEGDPVIGATTHGVDYEKFKLFAMSILWLASVSTRPAFANVDLGPHEEEMRKMLLAEEAGEHWRYGCGILFAPGSGEGEPPFSRALDSPDSLRFKSHRMYRFMLGQMFWLFPVSKQMRGLEAEGFYFSILEDGRVMFFNGGAVVQKYLTKFAIDLMSANERRQ